MDGFIRSFDVWENVLDPQTFIMYVMACLYLHRGKLPYRISLLNINKTNKDGAFYWMGSREVLTDWNMFFKIFILRVLVCQDPTDYIQA